VLTTSAVLHGAALVALGVAPSWAIFLLAAIPAGLGSGGLDGGVNGLFLDLFRTGRGRALNLLHLFFSLGALGAPLAVGRLADLDAAWQAILLGTGLAVFPFAALFAVVAMPGGRRGPSADEPARTEAPERLDRSRGRMAAPLLFLGVAIACYVASEIGVSNWLVRYLEPTPLSEATTALALFWGGLTLGRLASARLADRFDHLQFATISVVAMSVALLAAILVPSVPLRIALFAVTGFASGPIFPMIVAIGGDRYPDRSAAVGGFLAAFGVAGSIVYPPVMGFLSVTVGLTVAMLGSVVLGLACVVALLMVGRMRPSAA
jgi:fucose permease